MSNDTLIEVFAKGRLSQTEMRIALFIIRNSIGYAFNGSRQKWTKEFTVSEIAKDIGMSRVLCSRIINKMTKEGKLFKQGKQYQFNEHYEQWRLSTKSNGSECKQKVTELYTKSYGKCKQKVTAVYTNSNGQQLKSTDKKSIVSYPKETIKETINKHKRNISKDILLKDKKENATKRKMTEEQVKHCFTLVMWFSREILHIETPDKLWIAREMRHSYRLLYEMNLPDNVIKNICTWRIKDSFWRIKFHSLGSIVTHFTDWASEAKIKPLSFTDWLNNHPKEDYRKEENDYVRASRYLIAFNRAKRDGIIFTSDEIRKNTVAIRMLKEETEKYLRRNR